MKCFVILFTALAVTACHHSMTSWPSNGDRQEVAMYVRTRSLSGITPSPSVYQFLIYDKQNNKVTRYNVNPEKENSNLLHVKLFPGDYTGYCVTNAEEDEAWEYTEDTPPDQIYLKSQKTKNGHEEAKDHLLGQCDFEVTEDTECNAVFDLKRKVGMLLVTIENVPEWLSDLQINLSNIPQKMNLNGKYSGTYTLTKNITLPDESGNSETTLLSFPPQEKASLTLSSNNMVYISPEHLIDSMFANRVTQVKAVFHHPEANIQVDFTTRLVEWDDPIIQELPWEIDLPEGPCRGTGNGINLAANGSFEENFVDNAPNHWKLDASSDHPKKAISVTSPVHEGAKAVLIEGKTYLYQDIPINAGQCYQLNMMVNAPETDTKWKYWGTWLKGSTALKAEFSESVRSTTYEKQTSGYLDVYNGKIVRAPSTATLLRIEVRNYDDPVNGKGLYIDGVSVQAVN